MRKVADLMLERRVELAQIAGQEMGKRMGEAVGEVKYCASIIKYYADNGAQFAADEEIPTNSDGKAIIRRLPLGTLLGVMPWNFPYYQVARFIAPNLMLGNTVLLKHAEICAGSALAIQKLLDDAGVPKGVYINIFATHDQVADIIADDVYILMTPIEFLSNFIVRPATLVIRLLANMVAGHLLLVLCFAATHALYFSMGGLTGILAGSVTLLGGIGVVVFEILVAGLQAYIFALLAAVYISLSIEEH